LEEADADKHCIIVTVSKQSFRICSKVHILVEPLLLAFNFSKRANGLNKVSRVRVVVEIGVGVAHPDVDHQM
jgi:hypothetical protein